VVKIIHSTEPTKLLDKTTFSGFKHGSYRKFSYEEP